MFHSVEIDPVYIEYAINSSVGGYEFVWDNRKYSVIDIYKEVELPREEVCSYVTVRTTKGYWAKMGSSCMEKRWDEQVLSYEDIALGLQLGEIRSFNGDKLV